MVACVVDEYGSLVDIFTLEDPAEEVTGDVTDEHDLEFIDPIENRDPMSGGSTAIHLIDEVERAINHELAGGDCETISGMLIDHLKDLPSRSADYDGMMKSG